MYTPFLIGLNKEMDQYQMLKSNDQKVPKQAEAKRDGVINPHNYNFN